MEQTDTNGPVLEASAVDVWSAWSHHILITGVDWKVLPGEYWVIGGRHGSGKTDLLNDGCRIAATGSRIAWIFWREMAQLSETELLAQRRRIGFVFKGGGRMFAELTVAENVALALCYHYNWSAELARDSEDGARDHRTNRLAQETAQTIGSDWQQRVGLARALALKPEVMFFDEPASGLEARHRQWWRDFMAQLSSGIPYTGGRRVTSSRRPTTLPSGMAETIVMR